MRIHGIVSVSSNEAKQYNKKNQGPCTASISCLRIHLVKNSQNLYKEDLTKGRKNYVNTQIDRPSMLLQIYKSSIPIPKSVNSLQSDKNLS